MRALRLSLVIGIAAVALLATSAIVQADPGNGATVERDFECFVSLPPAPAATTFDTHSVITPSGNTILTCHFDSTNPTGKALHFEGFVCNTFLGTTTDSKYTLSASGQGTLTCKINGN